MSTREWQIEALRFTFIGLPDETVEHLGKMQNFIGIIPETVTDRPQQFTKTEEAIWKQGGLTLVAQPRRLDVIYSARQTDPTLLPNGGDFAEVGSELLNIVNKISGAPVGRIACAGVMLHKTPTVKDGYLALSELLPFMSFQDDMQEFALQINRPKNLEGLLSNELSKWSVTTIKLLQVNPLNNEPINKSDGETAVRFEFDFNTAESNPVPETIDSHYILRKLFERSLAVSQEGAK